MYNKVNGYQSKLRSAGSQVVSYGLPISLAGSSMAYLYQLHVGLIEYVLVPTSILLLYGTVVILRELYLSRRELNEQRMITQQLRDDISQAIALTSKHMPVRIPKGTIEVYVEYKSLGVGHFAQLLQAVEDIYRLVYSAAIQRNTEVNIDEWLRGHPEDRFFIAAISTENSIKLRCKTGWLPSITHDEEHFYIHLPQGIVVLIYVGGLLGAATKYTTSEYKDYLDTIKIHQEIEMNEKQSRKLDLEIEELTRKLRTADPDTTKKLEQQIKVFLDLTVRHEDVTGIRVKSRGINDRDIIDNH